MEEKCGLCGLTCRMACRWRAVKKKRGHPLLPGYFPMSADRTAPGGASLQLIPPCINVVVQSLHSPVVCVAKGGWQTDGGAERRGWS